MIGGFTQMTYAQVLAFPPGTKITVHNLSKTTEHTFNVVGKTTKSPARFPAKQPSFTPSGGTTLAVGFASGPIKPGKSITVMLSKTGTYLIECAFHYKEGMRDVLIVEEESEARSARNADSEAHVEPDANSGRRRQRLVIASNNTREGRRSQDPRPFHLH